MHIGLTWAVEFELTGRVDLADYSMRFGIDDNSVFELLEVAAIISPKDGDVL